MPDPCAPEHRRYRGDRSRHWSLARAWNKPFAYILNQTPIRGQRLNNAATTLSDDAALDLAGIIAGRPPSIVMRNDHQDALSAGLAVNEYAPGSKSAEEIQGLWQWIEAKLNGSVAVQNEVIVSNLPEAPLAPLFIETSAVTAAFVS